MSIILKQSAIDDSDYGINTVHKFDNPLDALKFLVDSLNRDVIFDT